MSDPSTRFVAGDAVAYVSANTLVITSAPIAGCADLVQRDATIREIIDVVSTNDDLAFVRLEAGGAHATAKGCGYVELAADTETRLVGGIGSAWPAEVQRVDAVRSVRLGLGDPGDATGSAFVLGSGVVPAVSLERHLRAVAPDSSRPEADPFDAMFGRTVARSVESAAVRDDGRPLGATSCPPVGVLLFSTGERVVVDKPMLLGRNPQPESGDVVAAPKLVKVAGAGVSRRHAVVTVDRWRAQIDDLGSANGTTVAPPGQPPRPVAPGRPVGLAAGTRVELGGEVSFVVEEVA